MSVMDEPLVLEVVELEPVALDQESDVRRAIAATNLEASAVEHDSLEAFLDLMAVVDTEYIACGGPVRAAETGMMIDWQTVSAALAESQKILASVQNLLSETLASLGVAEHEHLRFYADMSGNLRLVADHPLQEYIEATINSPKYHDLRTMYHAATSGLSMAGSLVGTASLPEPVIQALRQKESAA